MKRKYPTHLAAAGVVEAIVSSRVEQRVVLTVEVSERAFDAEEGGRFAFTSPSRSLPSFSSLSLSPHTKIIFAPTSRTKLNSLLSIAE